MTDFIDLAYRYFPYILRGAVVTLELTALALIGSVLIGLVVTLARMSPTRWLRGPAVVYIELIRATPALLQLFVVYFGLTAFDIRLDPFSAASLTLAVIGGAYAAEVFRAGIEAVDRGQYEAARSLGMPAALAMRRIILPNTGALTLPPVAREGSGWRVS